MEIKKKLFEMVDKYDSLIVFLVIECLALTAFSLADANIIFRYLGFLISFALIPFALILHQKANGFHSAFLRYLLVIIAFFNGVFDFFDIDGFAYGYLSVVVGTLALLLSCFAIRRVKKFKIDIALLIDWRGDGSSGISRPRHSLYRTDHFTLHYMRHGLLTTMDAFLGQRRNKVATRILVCEISINYSLYLCDFKHGFTAL
jgi:hypothetical protein